MKMTKKMMQERLDSMCDRLARKPACSRRESGRGRGGVHHPFRRRGVGKGALVQKVLKTASKYVENGYLFTRIQFKRIIREIDIIIVDVTVCPWKGSHKWRLLSPFLTPFPPHQIMNSPPLDMIFQAILPYQGS